MSSALPLTMQEILALLVVAAVVGVALWRRWRRRKVAASGCSQCGDKPAAPREAPIRFYRRRP